DAVDGMDAADLSPQQAAADRERLGEVLDAEQRRIHAIMVSSARMQATLWPLSICRSSGCAREHSSMAKRQRAAKRQPAGGLINLGTLPAMVSSRCLRIEARSIRGIERISPWV